MFGVIRTTVSKKKKRHKEDGFDLDLTYITPNLIAMGYPATNMESIYRNNITDVANFLKLKHNNNYRIYHLCSEKNLDESRFSGEVKKFPFDDHKPPRFLQILIVTKDAKEYLCNEENEIKKDRTIAINCKAGKGRTGVMICSCLVALGLQPNSPSALKYYGFMRTTNGQGVTIPSQRRYVLYFGHLLNMRQNAEDDGKEAVQPYYRPLQIQMINIELLQSDATNSDKRLQEIPMKIFITNYHTCMDQKTDEIVITEPPSSYAVTTQSHFNDSTSSETAGNSLNFFLASTPIKLAGDVVIQCKGNFKQKLFEFRFNTFFVVNSCPTFKLAGRTRRDHVTKSQIGDQPGEQISRLFRKSTMNSSFRGRLFSISNQSSRTITEPGQFFSDDTAYHQEALNRIKKRNNSFHSNDLRDKASTPPRDIPDSLGISTDEVSWCRCNCTLENPNPFKPDLLYQIDQIRKDPPYLIPGTLKTPHVHELILSSEELDRFDHHNLPSDMRVKITFSCYHHTCPQATHSAKEETKPADIEGSSAECLAETSFLSRAHPLADTKMHPLSIINETVLDKSSNHSDSSYEASDTGP